MNPAGHLRITLQPGSARHSVVISWSRPQNLHRVFLGKPLPEVLQGIPLLFNVCRRAQSVAAVTAAEQALHYVAGESVQRARVALLTLEMLHEHLWSLLLDLPPLLGLAARQTEMAAASQQLNSLMRQLEQEACLIQPATGPRNSRVQAEAGNSLSANLSKLLFDAGEMPRNSLTELRAGNGLAGALLQRTAALDWHSSWQPVSLQPISGKDLQAVFAEGGSEQSRRGQSLLARTSDTGALARRYQHPLVEASRGHGGNGLGTRLIALLVETDQLLNGKTSIEIQQQSVASSDSKALSCVETARGRLIYSLSLATNGDSAPVIDSMQVLSPTDWNFHPQGAATQLLGELTTVEHQQLETRAKLLIKLLNPCVAYQLAVENHAPLPESRHA